MSCNNNCYLPIPPRAWSRVQNSCSLFDETNFEGNSLVTLPYTGKLVPASTLYLEYAMLNKGNVLQYKKNSSNLTKQQRYAQIAKGKWTNRNTTWATQSSRGYTNPNNQSLQRVNSVNITLAGIPTVAPVTCPKPINIVNEPLPPASSGGSASPEVIPPPPPPPLVPSTSFGAVPTIVETPVEPIVIQDQGNLVCGTQENICTGEVISQPTDTICHPTTDSDVPGSIMELCWNDGNPTWYPRQRYVMTNSGNKWPTNAVLLSAVKLSPPVIIYSNLINNEIILIWKQDERCIPATEFTIYENGIPVKIVPGTTFTATILITSGNGEYVFYIVASNSTIVSDPSNTVTVIVNNSCNYNINGNYSVTYDYNTKSYTITFMYNPMNLNFIQLSCPVNDLFVTIVGGGGGGGKGRQTNLGSYGGGGGGGGGGIYTGNISLLPDTYNIVVGNLGKGSINSSDVGGQYGGDSYIQNSSLTNIAIAYAGGGGSSTQPNQTNGSGAGQAGGPISGGYGGKGGFNGGQGNNGENGIYTYSGGGGGGCGTTCCGGTGGSNGTGGDGGCLIGYTGLNGTVGGGYGSGGGGGSGNGGNGGDGYYGVVIFVLQTV